MEVVLWEGGGGGGGGGRDSGGNRLKKFANL